MARVRGVSMPEADWERVMVRVGQLAPRVKNVSHYVHVLVCMDLEEGLLAPIASDGVAAAMQAARDPDLKFVRKAKKS